jgi:hypothetical protein
MVFEVEKLFLADRKKREFIPIYSKYKCYSLSYGKFLLQIYDLCYFEDIKELDRNEECYFIMNDKRMMEKQKINSRNIFADQNLQMPGRCKEIMIMIQTKNMVLKMKNM